MPSLDLCDEFQLEESELQSLIFLAGYVGHKVCSNKVSCESCKLELVSDRTLQYDLATEHFDYLLSIDRGGLKWPTDLLVEIVTQGYLVFKAVMSKNFERLFLQRANHKRILHKLITARLLACGSVSGECTCGASILQLTHYCLFPLCNIFLNNYCKRASDLNKCNKSKTSRKLKTLKK